MAVPGAPVPAMSPQYMIPQGGNMRGGASQPAQGGYYAPGYTAYQQPYQQQYRKDNWKR